MTDFNSVQVLVEAIKTSTGADFKKEQAEQYAAYCLRLKLEKDRNGNPKNGFMQKKSVEDLEKLYRRVSAEGVPFDGKHVTLQSTGISYDYVALKNKMLLVYPESQIDIQLVYKADSFEVRKESGVVLYSHDIANPFEQKDEDVIGGYVVIRNKRGEFIVTLGKDDIQKHRNVAKTDYIWKAWFKEMCMKTVMKKACKYHFQDIYAGIEDIDNENYDLEKVKDEPIEKRLQKMIIDEMRTYQGDDLADLQKMCKEKKEAKEFTEKFARNILDQMGVNHADIS